MRVTTAIPISVNTKNPTAQSTLSNRTESQTARPAIMHRTPTIMTRKRVGMRGSGIMRCSFRIYSVVKLALDGGIRRQPLGVDP